MAIKAHTVRIYIGNYEVASLNEASVEITSDGIDVTTLVDFWTRKIQKLKDWSGSLGGFLDSSSNWGNQKEALNALLNSTDVTLRFEVGEGTDRITLTGNAIITSFSFDFAVDNAVEISIDFEGNGELTIS